MVSLTIFKIYLSTNLIRTLTLKFDVLDTFPRNYGGASTDGRTDSTTAWRTIQVQNDNYNDFIYKYNGE